MVAVFRLFGLWIPDSTSVYKLYSYSLHGLFTFYYTSTLIVAIFFVQSAKEIINSVGMMLTLTALSVKVLNIYANNVHIRGCLRSIEEFPLHDDEELQCKKKRVRMFSIVAWTLYCTGNTAGMSTYLAALRERMLPFKAWYPVETHFWSMYTFQVGGMLMLSNLNMTMELFPSYLMYMVSIKMEILSTRLRKLGKGVSHLGGYADPETVEQHGMTMQLADCIKVHQMILE